MVTRIALITYFLVLSSSLFGQDTLWLPGKNFIVGEVKKMEQGVLTIETPYSDDDLTIEWLKIDSIKTHTRFLVTLSGNERHTGRVVSTGPKGKAKIEKVLGADIEVLLDNIVTLDGLEDDFWGRVEASLDVSIQQTKANNLIQFNASSVLGYKADRWNVRATYTGLTSSQDSISDVDRRDYGVTFSYYPRRKWYIYSNITWFSNTEQAIDLRFSARLGLGRSIIQNNHVFWGLASGVAPVREQFSNETPDSQSTEWFIGTTWDLFDTGDLKFDGSSFAYPSLTESRRFRLDFTSNVKYDLPYDFYIKLSGTFNYDNQPAVEGNKLDFVWSVGFGWELDR